MRPLRIVVGVDGSPASRAALRWAAAFQPPARARLELVTVLTPPAPAAYFPTAFGMIPIPPPETDRHLDARRKLAEVAREELGSVEASLAYTVVLDEPGPARALTKFAGAEAVLVVGAHARHGLGFLVGSTTRECVRHARCAVVVVPANWTRPDVEVDLVHPDVSHHALVTAN